MKGAIIGDLVGSRFEFNNMQEWEWDFDLIHPLCHYTDDSLMTIAIAKTLIECRYDSSAISQRVVYNMQLIGHKYPDVGWGKSFHKWLFIDEYPMPYNSYGNGAAMRVSPVAWVAKSEDEVKTLSRMVTEVTHNHPEGIKGAEAIAMATYLARIGKNKDEIRKRMIEYYPELGDPEFRIKKIRPFYGYDDAGRWVTCQGSVPHAIEAFLDSTDFENAVRLAVWLGGDTDTIGCMCGSIAEAYYGIPTEMEESISKFLPKDLMEIIQSFEIVKQKRIPRKE